MSTDSNYQKKRKVQKNAFNCYHPKMRRKQIGNFYSEAVVDPRTKITKKSNFAETQLTKLFLGAVTNSVVLDKDITERSIKCISQTMNQRYLFHCTKN